MESDSPLVSVIIPTFNVATWIDELMASVLGQSHRNLEVIVIDDHSTDGTFEAVRRWAERDPRVQVMVNPARGGGSARNAGVARARGAYLAFADGDDIVPVDAYALMLARLESTGSDMAVGNFVSFGPDRMRLRSKTAPTYDVARSRVTVTEVPSLLRDRVCWNKLYRAEWWRWNAIEFSESLRSNDIFAGTVAYSRAQVDILTEPVYVYRQRVGGSSMTAAKTSAPSMLDHFREERKCADVVASMSPDVVDRYYTNVLRFDSWAHLQGLWAASDGAESRAALDEVLTILGGLIEKASEEGMGSLKREQSWVYRLISAGAFDLLRFDEVDDVTGFYLASFVDQGCWDSLDEAFGDDARDFFRYAIEEVLPGVLADTGTAADADVDAIMEAVAEASARYRLAESASTLVGEMLRTASDRNAADLLQVAAAQRSRASVRVMRHSPTEVGLDFRPVDAVMDLRHERGRTIRLEPDSRGHVALGVDGLETGHWRLRARVILSDRELEYLPRLAAIDARPHRSDQFRVIQQPNKSVELVVGHARVAYHAAKWRTRRLLRGVQHRVRGGGSAVSRRLATLRAATRG